MNTRALTATQILGERLKARRLELQLSQEDVAHLATLHVTNYGRIERGVAGPNFSTLLRLAQVLEVDPGDLIRGLDGATVKGRKHKYTASDFLKAKGA